MPLAQHRSRMATSAGYMCINAAKTELCAINHKSPPLPWHCVQGDGLDTVEIQLTGEAASSGKHLLSESQTQFPAFQQGRIDRFTVSYTCQALKTTLAQAPAAGDVSLQLRHPPHVCTQLVGGVNVCQLTVQPADKDWELVPAQVACPDVGQLQKLDVSLQEREGASAAWHLAEVRVCKEVRPIPCHMHSLLGRSACLCRALWHHASAEPAGTIGMQVRS